MSKKPCPENPLSDKLVKNLEVLNRQDPSRLDEYSLTDRALGALNKCFTYYENMPIEEYDQSIISSMLKVVQTTVMTQKMLSSDPLFIMDKIKKLPADKLEILQSLLKKHSLFHAFKKKKLDPTDIF